MSAPHSDLAHEDGSIRDPLASLDAVLEARRHSLSERLELALSWNAVAAELRSAVARDKARAKAT
jgi:hypothetical protein